MSSVSRIAVVAVVVAVTAAVGLSVASVRAGERAVVHLTAPPMTVREIAPDPHALRVCADPNNLPFSNAAGEGFENAIATLVARDLGKQLRYFWMPQRRGFVRNSLRVGVCDLIIGVPAHYELVRTTRPYYRSSYVFVTRGRSPAPRSLDDPVLRHATIGIQITGDDYENPPAAEALAARHLADRVRGYPVYGDYSRPDPQRAVVDDVGQGRIDTAIVWGPIAGYFARGSKVPLHLSAVSPERDPVAGPFTFDIAMGVRSEDVVLARVLDEEIARRQADIDAILRRFGVPLVDRRAGS